MTERIYRDEFAHQVLRFASREMHKAEADLATALEAAVIDVTGNPTEEAQTKLQSQERVVAYWRAIREAVVDWAAECDLRQPPRLVEE